MNKSLMTIMALCSLGISGCQTTTVPEPVPRAPSNAYASVIINGIWHLGGHRLDHETTTQGKVVLRAKAEDRAKVACMVPPTNSRVMVEGYADEITYNSFTSEFLLQGNARLVQGDQVISVNSPHSQLILKEDGEVRTIGSVRTEIRQVPENWDAAL